jgi:lipopolysaccharide export system protein LptC
MFKIKKSLAILTLVMTALLGYLWYLYNPYSNISFKTKETGADLVLFNLKVSTFDNKGFVKRTLFTPKLEKHNEQKTNLISAPKIFIFQDQIPWLITAKKAKSYDNNTKILLLGDVNISQQTQNNGSLITTDSLWYFPADQIASTNDNVSFKQPGMVMVSKGMKVNLLSEKLELLQNARGKYDPNHG